MYDKEPHNSQDKDGLFIPNRQLSAVVAGALSLVFFVFIGGYFLGKSHMVEPFVAKVEHDSFADQIYSSLCVLSGQEARLNNGQQQSISVCSNPEVPSENEKNVSFSPIDQKKDMAIEPTPSENENVLPKQWYAQLIGYGKEQSALAFVEKLGKKGISVKMKTRTSITPKGKKRRWYQVITDPYHDRDALQGVVDKIVAQERLKGVQIRSC